MMQDRKKDQYRSLRRLRIGGLYEFSLRQQEPGFFFSGESHPTMELLWMEQGKMHSVAQGRDLLLEPGELVLYGPDQWHMQYGDLEEAPCYYSVRFELEGVDVSPLLNRKIPMGPGTEQLLQQILQEREGIDGFSQDMILSQLNLLVMILLRQEAPKENQSLHGENDTVCRAQQYVSGHLREKLSVSLLAKQIDVSPSYLTALFHKNLSLSPGEYIRRAKLQESKDMIRQGKRNFTEIAQILEYSTVHHFSRQFKEKFGITPSEYAKSVR